MYLRVSEYTNLNANEEHYLINICAYELQANQSINNYQLNGTYIKGVLSVSTNTSASRCTFSLSITNYTYENTSGLVGTSLSYHYVSDRDVKNNGIYSPNSVLNQTITNYVNVGSDYNYANLVIDTWYDDGIDLSEEEYSTIRQSGYDTGYNEGNEQGYTRGYNDGVSDGLNGNFDGAFTLIGTAFDSAGGLLNTTVIGGLTIGTFIIIPIAITVVLSIFKMLRK